MSQSIRHPEILELARRDGKVTVEGLAGHFGVAVQTIRRDLADLAEAGRLERVHGGAVLPSGTSNIQYEARRSLHAEAKSRIAARCAEHVPDDVSLFLNIGTTTEAVARNLLHHRNLFVVTNNVNVAQILAANPEARIVLTGGTYRGTDGGLVGQQAADTLRRFRFDMAIIGCSALDPDGDILDFDLEEVTVSQTALTRTRRSILAADHSKFTRAAPARIAGLSDLDLFVTDAPLPQPLSTALDKWDTRVEVI